MGSTLSGGAGPAGELGDELASTLSGATLGLAAIAGMVLFGLSVAAGLTMPVKMVVNCRNAWT